MPCFQLGKAYLSDLATVFKDFIIQQPSNLDDVNESQHTQVHNNSLNVDSFAIPIQEEEQKSLDENAFNKRIRPKEP